MTTDIAFHREIALSVTYIIIIADIAFDSYHTVIGSYDLIIHKVSIQCAVYQTDDCTYTADDKIAPEF